MSKIEKYLFIITSIVIIPLFLWCQISNKNKKDIEKTIISDCTQSATFDGVQNYIQIQACIEFKKNYGD